MPSVRAASSALLRSREAIAVTSLHTPFCMPGMTFVTAIFAVLRIPQRTLDIARHHSRKGALAEKRARARSRLLSSDPDQLSASCSLEFQKRKLSATLPFNRADLGFIADCRAGRMEDVVLRGSLSICSQYSRLGQKPFVHKTDLDVRLSGSYAKYQNKEGLEEK